MTLSNYDLCVIADTVQAFGSTWGDGYLRRLIATGQITQADADAVMRRVEFIAPLPTEWGVSA